MFQYEGPLDLTEYYVRNTELRASSSDLIRVKVDTKTKTPLSLVEECRGLALNGRGIVGSFGCDELVLYGIRELA